MARHFLLQSGHEGFYEDNDELYKQNSQLFKKIWMWAAVTDAITYQLQMKHRWDEWQAVELLLNIIIFFQYSSCYARYASIDQRLSRYATPACYSRSLENEKKKFPPEYPVIGSDIQSWGFK